MQCSVTVRVEVGPGASIEELEERVLQAGRTAIRVALRATVRAVEEQQMVCPRCRESRAEQMRTHGTKRCVVLTRFGRVDLRLRRLRCQACGGQFRPSQACLGRLGAANVTPDLAAACVLAGASWPYQTAARVLQDLSGAQVSAEEVRRLTNAAGAHIAAEQARETERLVAPNAPDVRAQRERTPPAAVDPVERLVVGLVGGWIPSREQLGGMKGKVGVVAAGSEALGKHGRHRLGMRWCRANADAVVMLRVRELNADGVTDDEDDRPPAPLAA